MVSQPSGYLLYDAATFPTPPTELFSSSDPAHRTRPAGGRGAAYIVSGPGGDCVVRHSRRGGLVARILSDHYLFTGLSRVRTFREWRLTAALYHDGLPVPRPLAAYFRRSGLFYASGFATRAIDAAATLAQRLHLGREVPWERIGACIEQFSDAGVLHPDLNAHNILVTESRQVFLIDFDRATRQPGRDQLDAMLARLKRSLYKLCAPDFPAESWGRLCRSAAGKHRDLTHLTGHP